MQICKFQPHNIVKHTFADKLFDCVWPFCGVVPERFKFLNAVNFIKNYMKMSLEKHNSYSRVTNSHGLFHKVMNLSKIFSLLSRLKYTVRLICQICYQINLKKIFCLHYQTNFISNWINILFFLSFSHGFWPRKSCNCCGNNLFDMGQVLVNKTRNWGNLRYEGGCEQEYGLFSYFSFADFIHLLKISSHRKFNLSSWYLCFFKKNHPETTQILW